LRNLTRKMLLEMGFTVLEAEDASHAIEIAKRAETHIDLLLTDVIMPGMSGWALADTLSPQHPGMRILYMSGYPDGVIEKNGITRTGISILRKPFTQEELMQRIEDAAIGVAGKSAI